VGLALSRHPAFPEAASFPPDTPEASCAGARRGVGGCGAAAPPQGGGQQGPAGASVPLPGLAAPSRAPLISPPRPPLARPRRSPFPEPPQPAQPEATALLTYNLRARPAPPGQRRRSSSNQRRPRLRGLAPPEAPARPVAPELERAAESRVAERSSWATHTNCPAPSARAREAAKRQCAEGPGDHSPGPQGARSRENSPRP
jgi:hypothetical protein